MVGWRFYTAGVIPEVEITVGAVLFTAAAAVAAAAGFISFYEYHGIGPQGGIVRRGPHAPRVAITFDDGPSPTYTPQILDILKDKDVKATFFVVGKKVLKYPEIAKRIVNEGHDIGNHTHSHRDLVPATRRIVLNESRKGASAIKRVTGAESRLFRPPRGLYSNAVRRLLVEEEGWTIVLWTVSSVDWRAPNPERIVRRVKRYARQGGIILFHDCGAIIRKEGAKRGNTVAALPEVIEGLRARGLEPVKVSELVVPAEDPDLAQTPEGQAVGEEKIKPERAWERT